MKRRPRRAKVVEYKEESSPTVPVITHNTISTITVPRHGPVRVRSQHHAEEVARPTTSTPSSTPALLDPSLYTHAFVSSRPDLFFNQAGDSEHEDDTRDMQSPPRKRARSEKSRNGCPVFSFFFLYSALLQNTDPIESFVSFRDTFLDELIRHEGLGQLPQPSICGVCKKSGALGTIKCVDCSGGIHMCQMCTVELHQRLPTHRIMVRVRIFEVYVLIGCLGLA